LCGNTSSIIFAENFKTIFMAKEDYLPTGIEEIDSWFGVWQTNIASVLTALSLPATHADTVKAKIVVARTAFTDWKNEKALAKSKSSDYKAKLKLAVEALRPYSQNLKTTPGYAVAIGDTIGIEGPESNFNPATAKPEGKAFYEGGEVTVLFTKPRQVKAAYITCKRGSETTFTYLATDTNSPYDDHRLNLDITKPENREYIIQYVDENNQLFGQPSDTIKVTVP
jgi:hypothetical protein